MNLIPSFIRDQLLRGRRAGRFEAVSLFIDVSGFTAMTEALASHGNEGAEALADALFSIFDPLVTAVYERGGFVTTFAGDGFTALFPLRRTVPRGKPPAAHRRAADVVARVQRHAREHPRLQTRFGSFPWSVKVGMGEGSVEWGILGPPTEQPTRNSRAYFFRGPAVEACAKAEHAAGPDDWVVTAAAARSLGSLLQFEPTSGTDGSLHIARVAAAIPRARASRVHLDCKADVVGQFFPPELVEPNVRGEFRRVVVAFVGLPGSPGVEALERVVAAVFRLLRRYGGTLTRLDFGDKGCYLLLVWGAPVHYEDDGERAARLLLDLRDELAGTPESAFRAGVTRSFAYAGYAGGSLQGEFTCYGRGVNLAARLMMAAGWGELWLGAELAGLLAGRFETTYLGQHALKGIITHQQVYALRSRRQGGRESLFTGSMVGRNSDLDRLMEIVRPLGHGRSAGVVYVYGEAGIGKSRLVHEFRVLLELPEVRDRLGAVAWIEGRADTASHRPLSLFADLLTRRFGLADETTEKGRRARFEAGLDGLLAARLPGSGAVTPALTPASRLATDLHRARSLLGAVVGLRWPDSLYEQLDARARHENTLRAIRTWIQAEASIAPLVLVVEDGHWVDEDSIAALREVARSGDSYPLLLILTLRPADDGSRPTFGLHGMTEHRLDLDYLDAEEVRVCAQAELGEAVGDELVELLLERSLGNPFFVLQLARHLHENGQITLIDGGYRLKVGAGGLPDALESILVARLDRLTADVKKVVKAASVIGREFDVRLIEDVLGRDPHAEVREAERCQIWSAESDRRYLFKHALLRDAAYGMQLGSDLRDLHHRTAEAIERVHAESLAPRYAEVAYHYEQAEAGERAGVYYRKAADQARDDYRNEAALALYNAAAKYLTAPADLAGILANCGALLQFVGRWEEAEAAFRQRLELARGAADALAIADAERDLAWMFYLKGDYDEALASLDLVRQRYEQLDDELGAADAIGKQGSVFAERGDWARALECYEIQLRVAEHHGDQRAISKVLSGMGIVYVNRGRFADALARYERKLAIAERLGDKPGVANAIGNMGVAHTFLENYQEAMRCHERRLELSEELGDKQGIGWAMTNMGIVHHAQGNFAKVVECFQRALEIADELGDTPNRGKALGNLGIVYAEVGRITEAIDAYKGCLEIAERSGERRVVGWVLDCMGALYSTNGEYAQAEACFERSIPILLEVDAKHHLCKSLQNQAELYYAWGRIEEAKVSSGEALRVAEEAHTAPVQFAARLLSAKIAARSDQSRAVSDLERLLDDYTEGADAADLRYELYQLTGDERYRQQALDRYRQLHDRIPMIRYRQRIDLLSSNTAAVWDD